jgi:hypothetical protein
MTTIIMNVLIILHLPESLIPFTVRCSASPLTLFNSHRSRASPHHACISLPSWTISLCRPLNPGNCGYIFIGGEWLPLLELLVQLAVPSLRFRLFFYLPAHWQHSWYFILSTSLYPRNGSGNFMGGDLGGVVAIPKMSELTCAARRSFSAV